MANSAIRHSCEHMRSHARRLKPLACGCRVPPAANFLLRQGCARLRSTRSGRIPWPLTATAIHEPKHPLRTPANRPPAPSIGRLHERGLSLTLTIMTDGVSTQRERSRPKSATIGCMKTSYPPSPTPHLDGIHFFTGTTSVSKRDDAMTFAILGWGSLLWDTDSPKGKELLSTLIHKHPSNTWARTDPIKRPDGGLKLNLEFSRVSSTRNGALTLVIDRVHCKYDDRSCVYCAETQRTSIDEVVKDLAARDETSEFLRSVTRANRCAVARGD